jgi:hypothetical protein
LNIFFLAPATEIQADLVFEKFVEKTWPMSTVLNYSHVLIVILTTHKMNPSISTKQTGNAGGVKRLRKTLKKLRYVIRTILVTHWLKWAGVDNFTASTPTPSCPNIIMHTLR